MASDRRCFSACCALRNSASRLGGAARPPPQCAAAARRHRTGAQRPAPRRRAIALPRDRRIPPLAGRDRGCAAGVHSARARRAVTQPLRRGDRRAQRLRQRRPAGAPLRRRVGASGIYGGFRHGAGNRRRGARAQLGQRFHRRLGERCRRHLSPNTSRPVSAFADTRRSDFGNTLGGDARKRGSFHAAID